MADININIKIPEEHIVIAWEAINAYCGAYMTIEARSSDSNPEDELDIRFDFRIDPKDLDETNKQFAERWISEYVKAAIKGYWLADDTKRYREDVTAVDPPTQIVDENVVIPA